MQKLVNTLRAEARRSPKKAAALGLLALVAVWFWWPLMWGWLGLDKKDVARPTPAAPSKPSAADAVPPGAGGVTPNLPAAESPATPWHELLAWRSADPLTRPADLPIGKKRPFGPLPGRAPDAPKEPLPDVTQKIREALAAVTPQSCGLQVTSIMIGPRARLAIINNEVYGKGECIPLPERSLPAGIDHRWQAAAEATAKPGDGQPAVIADPKTLSLIKLLKRPRFEIVEVHRDHVLLGLGDATHVLPIAKAEYAGQGASLAHEVRGIGGD